MHEHDHQHEHPHDEHPGHFGDRDNPLHRDFSARAFTVGIGGPVGSGKTALLLALCRKLRDLRNGNVYGNQGEIVRTCISAPEGPVEIAL